MYTKRNDIETMNLDTLMTLEEVSAFLRASPQVIKKLCREGRIPATKIGKFWRFSREELDAWLRNRK
jgi:excisionase family DNA binding protein